MQQIVRAALSAAIVLCAVVPSEARSQTPVAAPTDSAKLQLIRQLLARVHATDQALQVMEQQIPAQRAANPRVPAEFWDRFLEQARARRGELEDGYAALYDRHFTTADIRQLLAFYDTPVGRRFLEVQPMLMREGIALGQEWGSRIGAEVGRTLSAEGVKPGP
jgi:uncharacterized protein